MFLCSSGTFEEDTACRHSLDMRAILTPLWYVTTIYRVKSFVVKQTLFSFSRMDMRLRLEATTRRAGCSTSGLTRSWRCTATTTSSAASPVSPSARAVVFFWPVTMTSTVTSGMLWEQREQVGFISFICWDVMFVTLFWIFGLIFLVSTGTFTLSISITT